MPDLEQVWATSEGIEVRIKTDWMTGPPDLAGDPDLVKQVARAIEAMGPYDDSITTPDLDRDLEAALRGLGLARVAYVVDHDLAAGHLRAAVVQAEESARKEIEFEEKKSALAGKPISGDIDFLALMLPMIALDRALEASRNAVILSVASLEAFINQVAAREMGIWGEEEDRLSLYSKWILIPRQLTNGRTFDKGREPFQSFRQLLDLRNKLVHAKGAEKRFEGPLGAILASRYRPDWDVQPSDGRWACSVARQMLLEYARIIGGAPPRWCSVVPPSDPRKPKYWVSVSAVIMTGTREDPDFPKLEWPPTGTSE